MTKEKARKISVARENDINTLHQRIAELAKDLENRAITIRNQLQRIKELEAVIDRIKRCDTCKHRSWNLLNYSFCSVCNVKNGARIENPLKEKCDKWEIDECRN